MTELQRSVLDALTDQSELVTVEELRKALADRGVYLTVYAVNSLLKKLAAAGLAAPEKVWRKNPAKPRSVRQINAWKRCAP